MTGISNLKRGDPTWISSWPQPRSHPLWGQIILGNNSCERPLEGINMCLWAKTALSRPQAWDVARWAEEQVQSCRAVALGSEGQTQHHSAVWSWTSYIASLSLSLPICKMGIIRVTSHKAAVKMKCRSKHFRHPAQRQAHGRVGGDHRFHWHWRDAELSMKIVCSLGNSATNNLKIILFHNLHCVLW